MTNQPFVLSDLLADCEANNIKLSLAREGKLSIEAPQAALTTNRLEQLEFNKSEIIAAIESFEERAAIIEFEAGLSRHEAERLAKIPSNA